jgi:hypothetical protein
MVDGESIRFQISEKFARRERPLTNEEAWERKQQERRSPGYSQLIGYAKNWIFVPTGKLTLELEGAHWTEGLRKRWSDRLGCPLETQLGNVLAEAVAHAAAIKEQRATDEKRRIAAEEAEIRRKQEARRREEESRRVAFLEEYANIFAQAERLAAYLQHLRRTSSPKTRTPEMDQFIRWCTRYVADLRQRCSGLAVQSALDA